MPLADPKSVQVHLTTGTGVEIEWKDGHRTRYSFQWLRDGCPCATCDEERKADHRRPGEAPRQPAGLLPLYKEPARPREVLSVGRYAINFVWNDGHNSGIYSWDYLRAHCQCALCQEQLAANEVRSS